MSDRPRPNAGGFIKRFFLATIFGIDFCIDFEIVSVFIFWQKVCKREEKNVKKPAKATYAFWRTFSKSSGEHFQRSPEWRTISTFRHPAHDPSKM